MFCDIKLAPVGCGRGDGTDWLEACGVRERQSVLWEVRERVNYCLACCFSLQLQRFSLLPCGDVNYVKKVTLA